jgi:hypothetical protein
MPAAATSILNRKALALAASRKKKSCEKKKTTTIASSSPTGVNDFVSDFNEPIYNGGNRYDNDVALADEANQITDVQDVPAINDDDDDDDDENNSKRKLNGDTPKKVQVDGENRYDGDAALADEVNQSIEVQDAAVIKNTTGEKNENSSDLKQNGDTPKKAQVDGENKYDGDVAVAEKVNQSIEVQDASVIKNTNEEKNNDENSSELKLNGDTPIKVQVNVIHDTTQQRSQNLHEPAEAKANTLSNMLKGTHTLAMDKANTSHEVDESEEVLNESVEVSMMRDGNIMDRIEGIYLSFIEGIEDGFCRCR